MKFTIVFALVCLSSIANAADKLICEMSTIGESSQITLTKEDMTRNFSVPYFKTMKYGYTVTISSFHESQQIKSKIWIKAEDDKTFSEASGDENVDLFIENKENFKGINVSCKLDKN